MKIFTFGAKTFSQRVSDPVIEENGGRVTTYKFKGAMARGIWPSLFHMRPKVTLTYPYDEIHGVTNHDFRLDNVKCFRNGRDIIAELRRTLTGKVVIEGSIETHVERWERDQILVLEDSPAKEITLHFTDPKAAMIIKMMFA